MNFDFKGVTHVNIIGMDKLMRKCLHYYNIQSTEIKDAHGKPCINK
ncbi:Putative uncharacterized protein [Moritella viscosa]|uniref:Uncharacterized protein n=1 Tax=Moritella viscosa TaxID=80854 RepID=A0A1L0ANP6_9GAMM|nr:Putative uncharacterized protein [Moritella viscosa]SGY83909.1 Putative uncharacterized protein [Moritella viscosa]SGY84068.1 Putative uncharacterized protein [Moritella viscosa]SHO24306.1 Putative uncharacterized protein [Moritella viscosa]